MRKRILAVDDSRTMLRMVSDTLSNAGFDTTCAADGQQALDAFRKTPFDLVITDLNLPVMDGYDLISHVRQGAYRPFVPILMLTTEADAAHKERGRAVGATGWIVKPFNPDRLIEVVRKVCHVGEPAR